MQIKLKELRKKENLSLNKLKEILKNEYDISVSDSQLMYYENEIRKPRDERIWSALADHFGVNIGYLLGFTEGKVDKETEDIDHERFTKGFDKILSLTGYTSQEELISSLTQSLNPEKFAENFISENSSLTQEELHERYSEAVEQQVQQILGELSILSIALSYLNDEASELLTIFFFLSDDEREKLLEIARVFSQNK